MDPTTLPVTAARNAAPSSTKRAYDRPIRVVHLIDTFNIGGAEVLLLEGLPRLLDLGFDIRIRALSQPLTLQDSFRSRGIDAEVLSSKRAVRTRDLWQILGPLRSDLQRTPADIVHTHLFDATLIGRMAGLAVRPAPHIVTTLHNPVYSNLPLAKIKVRGRRLVDWATGLFANESFVSVSDAVASDYTKHVGSLGAWGRMNVIYNGIDVQRVSRVARDLDHAAVRAKWGWVPGELAILSVGHLKQQKNYSYLVDTVTRLRADGIPARAVVIGGGGEATRLRAHGGDLVHFVGSAPREEVWKAVAACDVYVQPSHFEGFGLAILEAMALARPVVATKVDGVVELVQDGQTGLLVPLDDVNAFAAAIRRVAYEPGLAARLGSAAKTRALAHFGLESWVARTAALYRQLAGSRGVAQEVPPPPRSTSDVSRQPADAVLA
jgi:glycosyltransferase involved in cell wall biosynthesis